MMGSNMSNIALNTAERILLKVPTSDGYEYLDPRLIRGATYQQVADEATAYEATAIYRFDEESLTVEDITETVVPFFSGDFSDAPAWMRGSSIAEQMAYEDLLEAKASDRHHRSLRSPSVYLEAM
ncbi:hypothetical protein D584_22816 [Brucella intermedia M86]|uniref:Uncharacterized protein n=2 Tax=Brucella intermedia TaxID=94625 RepID=M5JKI3_9HYPH|nr:hypothetical protein D584_22816 [Brucella intermedia M86]